VVSRLRSSGAVTCGPAETAKGCQQTLELNGLGVKRVTSRRERRRQGPSSQPGSFGITAHVTNSTGTDSGSAAWIRGILSSLTEPPKSIAE
jgi:hypothetical protein